MRWPSNLPIPLKPAEIFFILPVAAVAVWFLTTPYYYLSLLPSLLLLGLLGLSHRPQIGYYLLVFLVPFNAYTDLFSAYPFLTLSKFVGVLVFGIVLFNFILKKENILNFRSNLWPLFILFFVVNLFSTLLSDFPLTAFDNLRKLTVSYIFIFLTLIFVSRNAFRSTLPAVIIVSVSMGALLSIVGYVYSIPMFAMGFEEYAIKRGTGGSSDPNLFASMLLFGLSLVPSWFFADSRLIRKVFAVILFLIITGGVILTFSRSGALVMGFILLLTLIEFRKRFNPRSLGFVGVALALAVIGVSALVPSSYWERQKSLAAKSDPAMEARFSYLIVGREAFLENPLMGAGPGTFRDIYANTDYAHQYVRKGHQLRRYAHNSYLEILVGTGLPGFALFLAVNVLAFRNFQRARKQFLLAGEHEMATLTGAYRMTLISILAYFLFLSAIDLKYYWMGLALSQVALKLSEEKRTEAVT